MTPSVPTVCSARPKIVVLGMMTKMPVAGVVWQTVHYLLGFSRLGYDVYYVEAHARTPSMLMEQEGDDSSARAAEFIAGVLRRFGLGDRWAFHALHLDGRCYGMSESELHRLYRSAALIVNLHGGTQPLPEHSASGRLVYLETDPVQLQVELHDQVQATIDFLEPHCAFFTFAENYGRPECPLPVSDRFPFRPTRQPVVMELWRERPPARDTFTTVGNWRQSWRPVHFGGDVYSWSKHEEFAKFIEVPELSTAQFELALSSCEADERRMLEAHGWAVRDGLAISTDLDRYRHYITSSRGEFTVAKDQNVRLRTGWFSDRSATYLAAGRPVIAQETGFSDVLRTGEGLFGFSSMAEALDAVDAVEAGHARHSRAAAELALEFFSSDVVLGRLLEDLGMVAAPRARRHQPPPSGVAPLPDDLDLVPTSRRPTTLPEQTVAAILDRPLPIATSADAVTPSAPAVSIVVVTFDNLVFNRMCLESVLTNTDGAYELIVVDNGSTDGTRPYLEHLAENFGHVSVITNDSNLGFAPAANQGLAVARGEVLVLLNNDTVVPPGWLARLTAHLEDPAVGMVGPVTNEAPNKARVRVGYRTYGEMVGFTRDLARQRAGQAFDVPVLTMFCTALRRSVLEAVGPLDERFEVGMFEDDDYAERVRRTGLRIVCAEDSFVHHFGEASLGHLVRTGRHAELFRANRLHFEQKWGVSWESHAGRVDPFYDQQRRQIRETVRALLPVNAAVAVVSKGDEELLLLDQRPAWHFPAGPNGRYTGYHPGDSDEALAQLRAARERGAEYLVIPGTARWWLEYYREFAKDLWSNHRMMVHADACIIFALTPLHPTVAKSVCKYHVAGS